MPLLELSLCAAALLLAAAGAPEGHAEPCLSGEVAADPRALDATCGATGIAGGSCIVGSAATGALAEHGHVATDAGVRPMFREHSLMQIHSDGPRLVTERSAEDRGHLELQRGHSEQLLSRSASQGISVRGRQLLVGDQPLFLKGICWNPVPRGTRSAQYDRFAEQDGDLMQAAGINAVRTYSTLTDRGVLDALWARGIWVANTVYATGGDDPGVVVSRVQAMRDHPAILMWVIGNEWNYNKLYNPSLSFDAALQRVREVARLVKKHDPGRPVSTIYGHLPTREVIERLPQIDIWGLNVYTGISLGDIFRKWQSLSGLPMYLGEYGADAYNALIDREDEESQALATTLLTKEILAHSSFSHPDGVAVGGFLFEFSDEWWKDGHGRDDQQDVGGIAPGGGPYPDSTFNEEFWGIVQEDRRPRLAYKALAEIETPGVQGPGTEPPPYVTEPPSTVTTMASWQPSYCMPYQVRRRRRDPRAGDPTADMCYCRRRDSTSQEDLPEGWSCSGNAVVPTTAPSQPSQCASYQVRRRRRDPRAGDPTADMCYCRRRDSTSHEDLPEGWSCNGNAIVGPGL